MAAAGTAGPEQGGPGLSASPGIRMRAEFERVMAGSCPENWHEAVAALKAETRRNIGRRLRPVKSSQKALEALVPAFPELVGGSADLTGSNLTLSRAWEP